jgi:hypothetical protein
MFPFYRELIAPRHTPKLEDNLYTAAREGLRCGCEVPGMILLHAYLSGYLTAY